MTRYGRLRRGATPITSTEDREERLDRRLVVAQLAHKGHNLRDDSKSISALRTDLGVEHTLMVIGFTPTLFVSAAVGVFVPQFCAWKAVSAGEGASENREKNVPSYRR